MQEELQLLLSQSHWMSALVESVRSLGFGFIRLRRLLGIPLDRWVWRGGRRIGGENEIPCFVGSQLVEGAEYSEWEVAKLKASEEETEESNRERYRRLERVSWLTTPFSSFSLRTLHFFWWRLYYVFYWSTSISHVTKRSIEKLREWKGKGMRNKDGLTRTRCFSGT